MLTSKASPFPPFFLFPFLLFSPVSSLSFLSFKRDLIPASELGRASFPIEPSLQMTTEAEDMVEERDMLSVNVLSRECCTLFLSHSSLLCSRGASIPRILYIVLQSRNLAGERWSRRRRSG